MTKLYRCTATRTRRFTLSKVYETDDRGSLIDNIAHHWICVKDQVNRGYKRVIIPIPGVEFELVEVKEDMSNNKVFDLARAETGDILKLDDGELILVIRGTARGDIYRHNAQVDHGVVESLKNLETDLERTNRRVVAHYKATSFCAFVSFRDGVDMTWYKLFWEEKEVKELTVSEISKLLGYEVKVIGEE